MSAPLPGRRPSRRAVLLAGVTAATEAAGLVLLNELAASSGAPPAARSGRPTPRRVGGGGLPGLQPVLPEQTVATAAAHLHPWHKPVYWLYDYLHRYPHAHFPRRPIMLTIDDGPSAVWTPKYLRLLARHQVKATFCMIGREVRPNRSIARDVAEHGHAIANHSWSHDEALETRPTARLRAEIERTSAAIHSATGAVPTQFRAPGGDWGPRVLLELARQDLLPLGWNVDPRDWQFPGAGSIASTLLAAGPHDIMLCHDGGGDRSQTYSALKTVIPALLDRGYHFVTLPAGH
jgi:peptidoglycan/xylan/chitin deacetylase (PgdA/CDA1 family)